MTPGREPPNVILNHVIDVHIVNSSLDWFVTGLIGLGGAAIGAGAAIGVALFQKRHEVHQAKLEMLSRASGSLLDAFVVKQRQIIQALRDGRDEYVNRVHGPRAELRLRDLELGVTKDIYVALPFVSDPELARRLLMAREITIACRRLIERAPVELDALVVRSILEVQDFFVWLRWNLENAQNDKPLPEALGLPALSRALEGPPWIRPRGLEQRKDAGL